MFPGRIEERNEIEHDVSIELSKVTLDGILGLPETPRGIVLFAHGCASSRRSPRNQYVAEVLQFRGIATLLFDLLTREEAAVDQRTSQLRFNIRLLAKRLVGATRWVMRNAEVHGLQVGYFGASTGAAAAFLAAAHLPDSISAIVSRGCRPDLAGEALGAVQAPTLLIAGRLDGPVITLNKQILAQLHCRGKKLVIVPGATHLFEEPGALESVAGIAADWFAGHFAPIARSEARHAAQAR
jgi:putative phosphoribosyl transferase